MRFSLRATIALLLAACMGTALQAGHPANCEKPASLLGGTGGLDVYGWVSAGFMGNTSSPGSRFNGPYNAVDRSNEPMLNQFYLVAQKHLPSSGTGLGGRVDFLFGEDYLLAESIGIEKRPDGNPHWNREFYGVAFPQAYAAIGNRDLALQIGHFYSVVGYEGVMAPTNFFYSKSLSYQFAGPFTHWGAQVNWKPSDAWTVQTGLTNGWDAFDRVSDSVGVVGRVRWDAQHSNTWTSFAFTTGQESNNLSGQLPTTDFTNRSRFSWITNLPLCDGVEYLAHYWLGFQEEGAPGGERADFFGIDRYVFVDLTEDWKLAGRFEWFKDEEGTRVGLARPSNPNTPPFIGDFYSISAGLNWKPCGNFIVRPEMRFDWFDGNAQPFDDGSDDSQVLLGFDAIVMF